MSGPGGRFGPYGGAFVPETVVPALDQLESAMEQAAHDAVFQEELRTLLHDCAGRPTPAERRSG